MGRICTNPHQSKQLLMHGFMAQSADLWWSEYALVNQPTPVMMHITEPILYSYRNTDDDLPAWSLTALLQALPGSVMYNDKPYYLHITKSQDIHLIEYTDSESGETLAYRDGIDLIDITVQMIIHLIKNNIPLNQSYIYNNI